MTRVFSTDATYYMAIAAVVLSALVLGAVVHEWFGDLIRHYLFTRRSRETSQDRQTRIPRR